jgi:hypothetical protein
MSALTMLRNIVLGEPTGERAADDAGPIAAIQAEVAATAASMEALKTDLTTIDAQIVELTAGREPLAIPATVQHDPEAIAALKVLNTRLRDLQDERGNIASALRQLQAQAYELTKQKAAAEVDLQWQQLAQLDDQDDAVSRECGEAFDVAMGALAKKIRVSIAKEQLATQLDVNVGRLWLGKVEDALACYLVPIIASRGRQNAAHVATTLTLDHTSALRGLTWEKTATRLSSQKPQQPSDEATTQQVSA